MVVGGGGWRKWKRARLKKEAGRKRPGESEVTVCITAPDPLRRAGPGLSTGTEESGGGLMKAIKGGGSGILPPQSHLTFLMTFEPV